jgi:hypothetical protein
MLKPVVSESPWSIRFSVAVMRICICRVFRSPVICLSAMEAPCVLTRLITHRFQVSSASKSGPHRPIYTRAGAYPPGFLTALCWLSHGSLTVFWVDRRV